MDQYAGSHGRSTYSYTELAASFINFLHHSSHLLDLIVQGRTTEVDAPTMHLDATTSTQWLIATVLIKLFKKCASVVKFGTAQ